MPLRLSSESTLGVSVVICAHNSAERLPQTLAHLKAQQVPPHVQWEVLLIDNGSTDRTAEIAENIWYESSPAPLRTIHEPRLGLTYARERSLSEAQHELVSFVDDDNWVCEGWVARVSQIMSDHGDVGLCGGYNTIVSDHPLPSWFEKYANYYAIGPIGIVPGDITERPGMIWGAGMCVRMAAFRDLEAMGFRLLSTTLGDDHEISLAMKLAGWKLWLDADLKMKHFMPTDRLTWEYFVRSQRTKNKHLVAADGYLSVMNGNAKATPIQLNSWKVQSFWMLRNLFSNLMLRPGKVLNRTSHRYEGDEDIIRIESYLGRLAGLWLYRNQYSEFLRIARKFASNCGRHRLAEFEVD